MTEIKKISDDFKNISKSDYLCCDGVDSIIKTNGRCILTIKEAVQKLAKDDDHLSKRDKFTVNGVRGDYNVVYFKEDVKPMISNMTNSRTLFGFVDTGKAEDMSVSKWTGLTIELIVDTSIKFLNNVGGMVILNELPITAKPELSLSTPTWEDFRVKVTGRIAEEVSEGIDPVEAKIVIRRNLSEHYSITDESWEMLCQ